MWRTREKMNREKKTIRIKRLLSHRQQHISIRIHTRKQEQKQKQSKAVVKCLNTMLCLCRYNVCLFVCHCLRVVMMNVCSSICLLWIAPFIRKYNKKINNNSSSHSKSICGLAPIGNVRCFHSLFFFMQNTRNGIKRKSIQCSLNMLMWRMRPYENMCEIRLQKVLTKNGPERRAREKKCEKRDKRLFATSYWYISICYTYVDTHLRALTNTRMRMHSYLCCLLGWECSERKRSTKMKIYWSSICVCVIKAQYLYTIHKAVVKWPFTTDTLYSKQPNTYTNELTHKTTNFTGVYCTKSPTKKQFKAYRWAMGRKNTLFGI